MTGRPRIVVLGMVTKMPVGGVLWQALHYLEGLRRLGCDVYYVEAHARTPSHFVRRPGETGSRQAAAFLNRTFTRFGFGDRWAFHALHDDGACFGMSAEALHRLYGSADFLINLHGGTEPRPEFGAGDRLVFVGTDPVQLEVELAHDRRETIEMLDRHSAFFTFAENYGRPGCLLPVTSRYSLVPTRQPVVLDFWRWGRGKPDARFTTIANWRQRFRILRFAGEVYTWSKHHEFLKLVDLPQRAGSRFELALSSIEEDDLAALRASGWQVRSALEFSYDIDRYRDYIEASRGEFTVAKDQNVRFRSGWFSDRSATYLAAGLPVITQETGFSGVLPTGRGLHPFSDLEDVLAAVDVIETDPAAARRGALEVAREYFAHDVVLGAMLDELGVPPRQSALPRETVLEPRARRPLQLEPATVAAVQAAALPESDPRTAAPTMPRASVIVVSRDNLELTRLCVESVLETTRPDEAELIVIDNASTDGTVDYLRSLAQGFEAVRPLFCTTNDGFARGCNRGLAAARGTVLILLNNDTIVPPGWLHGLCTPLETGAADALNPVTNRIAGAAEIPTTYRTLGGFLELARQRSIRWAGQLRDTDMLTMFCLALRRDVHDSTGPLDESFGIGLFEDDDYSVRLRAAGYRLAVAEDVLVHHFGEASFGGLYRDGSHSRLFEQNRRRFETKWGIRWQPRGRTDDEEYAALVERVRAATEEYVPAGSRVAVVSRGDERFLVLHDRDAGHFPQLDDGSFAGHYPADDADAIAQVAALAGRGIEYLVFPRSASWWLEHYRGLCRRLERCAQRLENDDVVIYRLDPALAYADMEGVA